MRTARFLILFSICSAGWVCAADTVAVFRFEDQTAGGRFSGLQGEIKSRLEKGLSADLYTVIETALPFDAPDSDVRYLLVVHGSIALRENRPWLMAVVESRADGSREEKSFFVDSMATDEAARIVAAKALGFLESGRFGRLEVASVPYNCDIFINKIKSGSTPKQFYLKAGQYHVRLLGEYLLPYSTEVAVEAGKEASILAEMKLDDYPTEWALAAMALCALGTAIAWQVAEGAHQEYMDEERYSGQMKSKYESYRTSVYYRNGFLGASITGTVVSAYFWVKNRKIRSRVFGE